MPIVRLYLLAGSLLARCGYPRAPRSTPDEYAGIITGRTTQTVPRLSEPLRVLTALCTRFRYGRDVASDQDVAQAQGALDSLSAALAVARKAR